MTFRTSKKHKAQESTKISTNALKLASRFQRFLNTGVGSKKDLKDVDDRFNSQLSQQGDKILTLLDQLKEVVSKDISKDVLDQSCEFWAKWLSSLDSKDNVGYSNLRISDAASDGTQGVLVEGVIDAETHLFQMLFAFKTALSNALKDSDSMDENACLDISSGAREIIETYHSRQRILEKIAGSKR
ncbi:MAG TPA: hypothetical protein VED17_05000 [Nitrososphaerales archaeon]|nr:hypothetical protein [Nitrososphaerales archaeon]